MDALMRLAVMVRLRDLLSGPAGALTGALNGITDAARRADAAIGGVAGSRDEMGRYLPRVPGMLDDIDEKLMKGGAVLSGISLGLGAAVGVAVKELTTLEDALAAAKTVWTETELTKDGSILALKEAALAWSKAHGDSAEDFVKTSYLLASAGLNHEQALSGTQSALTLAKATMGNAEEAGDLLATLYNTMGDRSADAAKELANLGDQVAKTQAIYQIANLNGLAQGLSYAVPASKQMGVSLSETLAILGQFNNAGLKGSSAGTAYASMMAQIIDASDKLGFRLAKTATGGVDVVRTIENIRRRFGDLNDMPDALKLELQKGFGGSEAFRAVGLLMDQTKSLKGQTQDIAGAAGTAAAQAQTIEATTSSALKKVKAEWVDLQIKFAETILPHLPPLMARAKELITALGLWLEDNPWAGKLALDTALWLGMLGPSMVALGGIFSAVEKIGGAIETLGPIWRLIGTISSATFGLMRAGLSGLGTLIMAHPMLAIGALLAAGIGAVAYYWDDVKGLAAGAGEAIKGIWNGVSGAIGSVFDVLLSVAGTLLSAILPQWAVDAFTTVWTYIKDIFSKLGNAFAEWGEEMWDRFVEGLVAGFEATKKYLVRLFDPAAWAKDITGITGAMSNLLSVTSKVTSPGYKPTPAGAPAPGAAPATPLRSMSPSPMPLPLPGERDRGDARGADAGRSAASAFRILIEDARGRSSGTDRERPTIAIQNLNVEAKDGPGLADELNKMARSRE